MGRLRLHPTPEYERDAAAGVLPALDPSHGCIHIRPQDIDDMIRKGYLRSGTPFKVYGYKYTGLPQNLPFDDTARGPYSVHFFPGANVIAVVGHNPGSP